MDMSLANFSAAEEHAINVNIPPCQEHEPD